MGTGEMILILSEGCEVPYGQTIFSPGVESLSRWWYELSNEDTELAHDKNPQPFLLSLRSY